MAVAVGAAVLAPLPSRATSSSLSPPPRSSGVMAADPASGTLVLFGGLDDANFVDRDDTWTWDGSGWSLHADAPFFRRGASMAYDGARGRVLLFGGEVGYNHNNETNDTWSWDGASRQWTDEAIVPLPGAVPPVRTGAAMAYDARTRTVVLFGGYAEGAGLAASEPAGNKSDTWIWDGSRRTWTKQTPPVSPPAQSGASMAFDEVRGKVLLFGDATWSWDGVARTWTRETPSVSPPPMQGASMTDHAPSGKVVLFGGRGAGRVVSDATWTWDGRTRNWSREAPRRHPTARTGAGLAFHAGTGTGVLFGGYDGSYRAALNDTWTWDGVNWRPGVRPVLTVGDVSLVEGDEGLRDAVFTLTLSEPASSGGMSVDYTTGTNTREHDPVSGIVGFPPGVSSRTVKVPVWGDAEDEADHQFTLFLSPNPAGPAVYDSRAVGTILDNDPPASGLRVGVGDVSVHEGHAGARAAVFPVTLSRHSPTTVTVAYATITGTATAPGDFTAKTGTLTFSPGVATLQVKVPIAPDTLIEGDETYRVTLSGATGAKISRATGMGTIVDDD